jgi:sodium-dependent dicarboxylate transporter 2/3/5
MCWFDSSRGHKTRIFSQRNGSGFSFLSHFGWFSKYGSLSLPEKSLMDSRKAFLLAGPVLFALALTLPAPEGLAWQARVTAGITLWIAAWWITEPVKTSVTSLLPLVLFPLSGVMPLKSVSSEYGNEIIYLFMAGFFIGKTIEKWNLHRRIALLLVSQMGTNPSRMVLGFMVATAVISMWISNTATAVMMTPVAIAVGQQAGSGDQNKNFRIALLLGVGYACSIGGLATIIGTPTNAIFISFVEAKMGQTVSFWNWFLIGFPVASVLLLVCWQLLMRLFPLPKSSGSEDYSRETIRRELAALGPVSAPEKRLLFTFGSVVLAWVTGSLVWYKYVNNCNDTVVAVAGAILLFLVPSGVKRSDKEDTLLDWHTASSIPWDIILLFGGGLALAKGFDSSGLALWIGEQLKGLSTLPHALILLSVLLVVVFLSEIASNIATASMMMPVLVALAGSIGANPLGLCLSATMAASFGFGLPIATAPNSIVFASGYMTTRNMAKAGFILDLLAILILLASMYILLPWSMGVGV